MRMLLLLGGLALIQLSAGCPSCLEEELLVEAQFEDCIGACGWSIDGAAAVSVVWTVHPAEHALLIDGWARLDLPLAAPLEPGRTLALELTTNCPPIAAELVAGEPGRHRLELALPAGPLELWVPGMERVQLPVTAAAEGELVGITVQTASGACAIDALRLVHPGEC